MVTNTRNWIMAGMLGLLVACGGGGGGDSAPGVEPGPPPPGHGVARRVRVAYRLHHGRAVPPHERQALVVPAAAAVLSSSASDGGVVVGRAAEVPVLGTAGPRHHVRRRGADGIIGIGGTIGGTIRATIANHITPSRRRVIGSRIALRLYIAYQQIARRH